MAFLDETGLTRLWSKIEGKFSQFSGNIENTIDAIENTYTKPYTDGNLILYVSKQGSDDNDGLSQETPLLTIDKAFEIANRNIPANVDCCLHLCVGPGDWGNFKIHLKPYVVHLYGFNYTNYITDIADIDSLPHFSEITVRSSIQIYNANFDSMIVYDNSYAYIGGNGVVVAGSMSSYYSGMTYIASNKLYIKNTSQNYVFYARSDGVIAFYINSNVNVYESLNLSNGFFYATRQSTISGLYNITFTLLNNVTVTGRKAYITAGSTFGFIYDYSLIPGNQDPFFENGAIVNGVTVGDTTHPGNKTFTDSITINGDHGTIENTAIILSGERQNFGIALQATNATKGTAPSAQINSGIEFYGSVRTKYQNRYGLLENTISTANVNTMKIVAYNPSSAENTGNCTISVNVDNSGNAYTYAPTPAVADSSTKIATTAWVRTATGNFACNAATATKVGTATVGSGTKPIYLNAGAPTAFTATVGSASKPVYLNAGALTALSATAGSASKPVWMNAGNITALTATVGGAAKPVYLNAGGITACSATVGSTARPVYLNAGTITVGLTHFTACSATAAGTAGPVTAPAKGKQAQFLRGDATWAAPSTGSDRRVKQDFSSIPDEVLDAWENIKYKQFKLKEEVSEKGNDALYHTGLVVQDIQEVFEEQKLNANKYNMIIHEVWPAHDDEYDEEGNLISPKDDGYEQYFMHYEEALSIEAAYLRKQVKLLKEKVDNLEKQISTINSKIS